MSALKEQLLQNIMSGMMMRRGEGSYEVEENDGHIIGITWYLFDGFYWMITRAYQRFYTESKDEK